MVMYLALSVRNQIGAWEVIERESNWDAEDSINDVDVFADEIGRAVGDELLLELCDAEGNVLDSREITAL
jgi:hypothetical protein